MKVYFDVTCLMPKKISGIGVYARELYKALKKEKVELNPVIKLSRVFKPSSVLNHINEKPKVFLAPLESKRKRSVIIGPDFRLLSYSDKFIKIVSILDLGVFHDGFNSETFRENGKKSIHETLYKGRPHAIVTPTEVIAEEVRKQFPDFANKTHCIHLGADHLIKAEKSPDRSEKKAPYFLYVGHLETRKNILGIVKGFEQIERKYVGVRLVIVGKDGFQGEGIRKYISTSGAQHSIDLRGFVSEGELRALYMNATAFVFPSFYEGFGFPILEAMSLGCPVITSKSGAMAELAGDAAILVDPHNDEQIGQAMEQVLTDSLLARKLTGAGEVRFRNFTWEKCAKSFINLYKSL